MDQWKVPKSTNAVASFVALRPIPLPTIPLAYLRIPGQHFISPTRSDLELSTWPKTPTTEFLFPIIWKHVGNDRAILVATSQVRPNSRHPWEGNNTWTSDFDTKDKDQMWFGLRWVPNYHHHPMNRSHSFLIAYEDDTRESPYPTQCSSGGHPKAPPRHPVPRFLGPPEPS